ncbi:hypothetical protein LOK49_LG04G00576 [Camellia lanceoleosa]|uniref:Uncharacterized protein n=1 Tax=Camellia lanceoleosa TaxID=1840588 RepID=A0ACC0HYB9_9ERIC|nr:hypothetical protein LOK49_LG04G00576 [Camellia lanceoleosa]
MSTKFDLRTYWMTLIEEINQKLDEAVLVKYPQQIYEACCSCFLRSPLSKCECLTLDKHIKESVLPGIASILESSSHLETLAITMSPSMNNENSRMLQKMVIKVDCIPQMEHITIGVV